MLTSLNEVIDAVRLKLPDYLIENGVSDPYKKFKCLIHDETDGSCSLHKSHIFVTCFGACNKSWDIFALAHDLEGFPISGPEFLAENVFVLADRYGIKYSIAHTNDEKAALKYNYFRAYKIISDFIEEEAKQNPTEAFLKELKKRKWKKEISVDYGLGCVNNFKDILTILGSNGFSKDFIELIGLNRSDIFNPDNVIFTIKDERNHTIAFYSRDVNFETKKEEYEKALDSLEVVKPKAPMKYNSTANFNGIYEKPLFPYGINDARDFHRIIIVEGHGCKHSLKLNGIDNAIALGGLSLSDATIDKLISLGATALVLVLDNDDKGKDRAKEIINKYYGKKPIDWYVIDMAGFPDVKDPDEFLRKYSSDAFKQLPERNALEWFATQELYDKNDVYAVIESVTPLIALEKSPINRLKIETIISDMTEIDKDIIHAEVELRISTSKDRKSEYAIRVLEEAKELVSMNPDALNAAVNLVETKIGALNKNANDDDLYSSAEVLKELAKMEELEDSGETVSLIKTGFNDFDNYISLPCYEAFILVPASPNSGKTTMFCSFVNGILDSNDKDTIVVVHTTDDSRNIYFNRLLANRCRINMNWLKKPAFFLDEDMSRKRKDAYKILSDYIRDERLIIKDVLHGNTIEYHGNLLKKIRDKNPSKNIVVFCDNFHKLDTELDYTEGRHKYTYISSQMKTFTNKYGCVEFNTVETNKQDMYQKPTDASKIKETGSLLFDANMIIYLWNEMNAMRESAELVFDSKVAAFDPEAGYYFRDEPKPIIEGLVLKNKLSDYKKSLYWKFHPELALYEDITYKEVKDIIDAKRKINYVTRSTNIE